MDLRITEKRVNSNLQYKIARNADNTRIEDIRAIQALPNTASIIHIKRRGLPNLLQP